jgi:hypothetical protein
VDSGEYGLAGSFGRGRTPGPPTEYFDDLAFLVPHETDEPAAEPEPLKQVRVIPPYLVSHEGARFFPDSVAEVPESVADKWIRSQWVKDESPAEAVIDAVSKARKRGRRTQPE